jgi:tRNA dimethylallyltransferase
MQVYRGMDIGTAKADATERRQVRHHLLDLCDPSHDMSVAEFQQHGRRALADLDRREVTPVICGGSGLHFRSLVDPLSFPPNDPEVRAELEALDPQAARDRLIHLDPQAADYVDLANPRRVVRALEIVALTSLLPSQRAVTAEAAAVREYKPVVDFVAVGLDPGTDLEDRVVVRFDSMIEQGLLAEVADLAPSLGRLASQAVGYKELLPVVAGEVELGDGRAAAIQATRLLAKRQRTFFRRDPRIHWVPWHPDPGVRIEATIDYLNGRLSWTL